MGLSVPHLVCDSSLNKMPPCENRWDFTFAQTKRADDLIPPSQHGWCPPLALAEPADASHPEPRGLAGPHVARWWRSRQINTCKALGTTQNKLRGGVRHAGAGSCQRAGGQLLHSQEFCRPIDIEVVAWNQPQ